jgi:hypothetical protein
MPVIHYAGQVGATLNLLYEQASRMSLPADAPLHHKVAWALLRLSVDHATSIVSNFHVHDTTLAGSPFALLRPLNETFKRGAWFALCAIEADADAFMGEGEKLPSPKEIVAALEGRLPFSASPFFTKQYQNVGTKFHGFTHGGREIVSAYLTEHGVGAGFREDDVYEVLDHAEALAMLAVQVQAMVAGEHEPDTAMSVIDVVTGMPQTKDRVAR